MKTLFLILMLFSFNAWSGFIAGSKINQCNRTDYISPAVCQEIEGEACYRVPNDSGECGIFKLKDVYGTVKFDQESCEGEEACKLLLPEKVCGVGRHPLINEDYTEVYCVEVVGKEMVIDETLKAQKDQEKAIALAEQQAEQNALARMDCGRLVIAKLLVRNASKTLTVEQVTQLSETYAPIQGLLLNGSLESAKTAIQAVVPDGVIVTEADKTALVERLDSCKPQ